MRHALKLFLAFLLASAPSAFAQETAPAASLKGKFLIADPSMPDSRFRETVIYMIAHSKEGAVGIVVNRPGARRPIGDLLRVLNLAPREGTGIELELFWGGPVAGDRVMLLLHSDEYKVATTVAVASDVALTPPKDALGAVADGRGPKLMLLAIGYAGWAPGQLERELEMKGWAVIDGAAAGLDLLFGADHSGKWERAWKMRPQDL